MIPETEEKKEEKKRTTRRSWIGRMAKRSKTPDLHLRKGNLRKIQPPSSILQAGKLLSSWVVKMETREKTLQHRPLYPLHSPITCHPERINQTSIQTRQNKTYHLLKTILNFLFFLKNEILLHNSAAFKVRK